MKQGIPKTLRLSREKRAAVSELLSIAQLSSDLQTVDVITTRVGELLGTGKVWLLTDDSMREVIAESIARCEEHF